MIAWLPLAFSAPWALLGLAALPAIWWLLRVTPPRPSTVVFPPLRLLLDIRRIDETPSRMPWWLVLLRLLIAALIILAMAGPIWRPNPIALTGTGPLWLVIDNGFAAAPDWDARKTTAETILEAADAADRPVVLIATADGPQKDFTAATAATALRKLEAVAPRAWFPDRSELLPALGEAAAVRAPGEIAYVAEPAGNGSAQAWFSGLSHLAGQIPLLVIDGTRPAPLALIRVVQDGTGVAASLRRVSVSSLSTGALRLLDRKGRVLDEKGFSFAPGALDATTRFDIPLELKNDVARAEIAGQSSASGVQLLDESWRRRTVGILTGANFDRIQPLIAPDYFLSKALQPFADVRPAATQSVADAIKAYVDEGVAALVLADVGKLTDAEVAVANSFMTDGGVLIRFSGPRLAAADDPLVPVPLRRGDRILGGSLSWEKPQHLGPFAESGPFFDVPVPDDVTVDRQVLAEPSLDLNEHTWASLADGTPLVTARRVGAGWLVLFHVTADTRWSNLPISGAFVDMLRRAVALGHGKAAPTNTATKPQGETLLPPLTVLDGYGRLGPAPSAVHGLASGSVDKTRASRQTPPGLYGSDDSFRAVNLFTPETPYVPLDLGPIGANVRTGQLWTDSGAALTPGLLAAAFFALLVDGLLILWLTGRLSRRRAAPVVTALALLFFGLASPFAPPAQAEMAPADQAIIEALAKTRLAYVKTGDTTIDETTRAGLWALSQYLASRSSLEPGEPAAVDPARDDLSLYPLLYWPIDATSAAPSTDTMARVEAFMKSGGTVLFDTRDQMTALPGGAGAASPEQLRLRDMLSSMDIPPLEPVPADHVLTKSFYLLNNFPGRYDGSPLWVEASTAEDDPMADGSARPVRSGDGVSPLIITGNDFAGGWAADENGSFLYPLVPGTAMQRDYAFRAGVNIVMYVLTGNYKSDQVHIPALLERLGQ
ncbi:DUF4159 domain-containing protein [Oryzibacter oryziterrae]|uniref:DUF4159 domain-containing protein n=1 Tax=Oryzibacter oryziterrae TaxID=2766474 RepID=UPI001F334CEC|nr:DUF4159 domain-containing protein [Oryzibacter oryziterrae]